MRPLDRLDALLIAVALVIALVVMAGLDAAQGTNPNDFPTLCEETRPC